mgnify:CR=1 FL=1
MSLNAKQFLFTHHVTLLIQYAYSLGYKVTFGDASRMDRKGHKKFSKHYDRLAIDLNLFKDKVYLKKTGDHMLLGLFWESLGHVWGGRFKKPDGNHYEN